MQPRTPENRRAVRQTKTHKNKLGKMGGLQNRSRERKVAIMKASAVQSNIGTPHILPVGSRREFLSRVGGGFGALAFSYLLGLDGYFARAGATPLDPLAPKSPHFRPKAKSVIWLFMEGGPSHLDLFDPKPMLHKLAGQPMPPSFGKVITAMGTAG